jgi:hypothetical protein
MLLYGPLKQSILNFIISNSYRIIPKSMKWKIKFFDLEKIASYCHFVDRFTLDLG